MFSGFQFLRVRSNTDPVLIYQMLTEEWGLAPPHLVVALVGGDELAQMKPWLRDTLRKGLVKAAQSTGRERLGNSSREEKKKNRALCWPLAVLPGKKRMVEGDGTERNSAVLLCLRSKMNDLRRSRLFLIAQLFQ